MRERELLARLLERVRDLVEREPEKAAKIVTAWVHTQAKPSSHKSRPADPAPQPRKKKKTG